MLSEHWQDVELRQRIQIVLDTEVLPGWLLGAVLLRGLMKALLGQMPSSALGVVMPGTKILLDLHGVLAFERWMHRAVDGEGFPGNNTKDSAKERFVKEIVAAKANGTHFKQLMKRFCGGKKKGCG